MNLQLLLLRMRKVRFLLSELRRLKLARIARVAPSLEHSAVLSKNYDYVYDVGANRGQFAWAARFFTKAQIVAFEPLSSAFSSLQFVAQELGGIEVINAAVGQEEGTATINISAADDSSSIREILPLQEQLYPGTERIAEESINVITLKSVLEGRQMTGKSLLKIDVQGYELEVLKGAGSHLERFSAIYLEASFVRLYEGQALFWEVSDYLRSCGFTLSRIYNVCFDSEGNSVQADFLFLPAER